ncbi:MAG: hypothetical protein IJX96_03930 [Clostridia bacterium]|nr:hypothetical protein [Clostridia bacterium]
MRAFLGKLFTLLLGIIIGVIAGIGGLVGAGYHIVTKVKLKDAADSIGGLTGLEIPVSEFLSDAYAENTVLYLVEGIGAAAQKIGDGTGTLNDLKEISPFIETLIAGDGEGGLVQTLQGYGFDVTVEDLMSKYIVKKTQTEGFDGQYLTDYLMLQVNDLPLGKVISMFGFQGNDLITALCYGVEGVDYQIVDGEYVMLGDSTPLTLGELLGGDINAHLNKLPLDALVAIDTTDAVMCALAYGASHRYTIVNEKVEMNPLFYLYDGATFTDDNGNALELQGEPIAVENEENAYMIILSDGTQQLVKKADEDSKYNVFTTDETPQLVYFPKTLVGDLNGSSADIIDQITLKDALNITESSHSVLYAIAYDGETPRTIGDLRKNSAEVINGISLVDLIPADTDDAVVMYLLYGKENVHYAIDPTTQEITMLKKRVAVYNGDVYDEYGDLITGATANGTMSYTIGETTYDLLSSSELGTIEVKVGTDSVQATLYYVQNGGKDVYYEPTTVKDMQDSSLLSNLTKRLTLNDVMEVGDHKILKHLAGEAIDDLPDAINNLSIDAAFGDHFYYRTYNPTTGAYASYRENGNHEPIDQNGNVVEGVYLVDINGNNVDYDNDGIVSRDEADNALTGTWKYLLMERKSDGTFSINHHHTLTEMDDMMDYMSNNVHDASIRELKLDGIVKDLDDETIDRAIMTSVLGNEITIKDKPVSDYGTTIGDLTVEELMLYMSEILELLPSA